MIIVIQLCNSATYVINNTVPNQLKYWKSVCFLILKLTTSVSMLTLKLVEWTKQP